MRITIISGSHRPQAQSARIAAYLAARLPQLLGTAQGEIVALAGNPLPLWEEGDKPRAMSAAQRQRWQPYADTLRAADGFIIISPEWAGMAPPGLKNFLLHCSPAECAHKPALLVTVSSSRGGAYPVAELRATSGKNNKLLYLPEHLIIREAETMLKDDAPAGKNDEYLRNRIDYGLLMLLAYAQALPAVRAKCAEVDALYPNGM